LSLKPRIGLGHPWVILLRSGASLGGGLNLSINRRIYFLDLESRALSESYLINGVHIVRTIGTFSVDLKVMSIAYVASSVRFG
jgi:hypothetical protein